MEILKFTIKGSNAFFKKPDVNTYLYLTYGNIHKIALIGILGAILGYCGYNKNKLNYMINKKELKNVSENDFPEFYDKLINLKVAIVPKSEYGNFPKKIQTFNNSVGYASKEQGGNLIVKEQWLENPKWNIYIIIDNKQAKVIADYILNKKAVYIPYLGKNDHFADIFDSEMFEENQIEKLYDTKRISGLFMKKDFSVLMEEEDDEEEVEYEELYKYEEKLPIRINKQTNMYELERFICTNMNVANISNQTIYKVGKENIVFY